MLHNSVLDTIDLSNCHREPIHIPGRILPHGVMLVVDPATFVVEQYAGDVTGLLGIDPAALADCSLEQMFSSDQIIRIRTLLDAATLARPRHLLDPALRVVADRPTDASVHLSDGLLLIELEDADLADRHVIDPLACVQYMFAGLSDAPDIRDYCQSAAERVRDVVGYDRVMIYRFMDDESGWVFAEARRPDLTPFLDLHFPAKDIPAQARRLYLTSPLRLITEIDYVPADLVPPLNPRTGRAVDMSYAVLRDVSPVHREYLRNIGVNASMSISIVHEGKLWGLIACHHDTPRRLPRHLRAICEVFGSIFSLQIEARLRAAQLAARLESRAALVGIVDALAKDDDYPTALAGQAAHLLDYIAGSGAAVRSSGAHGGVAIRVGGKTTTFGNTPSINEIQQLIDWLTHHRQQSEGIVTTDRLAELFPPAAAFAHVGSGLLAVSVSVAVAGEPGDYILWFRPELVQTMRWGEAFAKRIETGPLGDRLTPRASFDEWTETVRCRSIPWSPSQHDAAYDLRVALLEIVLRRIDATARERLRTSEQERLVMVELDHRVKNTLANIQALVAQTSRSAVSLTDFTAGLDRRIRSMSRAHSLLTQSRWEGVSIDSLLQEELDAYRMHQGEIVLEGPAVSLTPKAALAVSLAIHELATNAAKYGAFSIPSGRLHVLWRIVDDAGLELVWSESGGPVVTTPKHRGFGSTLIERALALETGGQSSLDFQSAGVVCTVRLPLTALHTVAKASSDAAPATVALLVALPTPSVQRILVVEDSALVLMEIEDAVIDLGWDVVGPASRLEEAVMLARNAPIDAALLDVNLDGQMSWDAAAILQERGIPFAFMTGYDSDSVLPQRFARQTIVAKPFKRGDIATVLRALLRETPAA